MANKDLQRENDKLRTAHGETGGQPNYKWEFSESLYFPMRKEPLEYDYVANEAGIIMAQPIYVMKLQAPYLHRQWVLCRFMAPPSETQWKNTYGSKVEYPKSGYYAATNAALDEGIYPWDQSPEGATFTDAAIRIATKDRNKSVAELDAEGEEIISKRERVTEQLREDMLGELLFSFPNSDHIPGKRGGGVVFGGLAADTATTTPGAGQ